MSSRRCFAGVTLTLVLALFAPAAYPRAHPPSRGAHHRAHAPSWKRLPPAYRPAKGGGVQVSTDGGRTWRTTLRHVEVRQIALGNTRARLDAYVAASAGCASGRKERAWVTHDGGHTWHVLGTNLASVAVDPRHALLVYGASCAGIVVTRDGGKSWTLLPGSAKPDYDPALVAIAASAPATIYVAYASEGGAIALRRTTDGGRTWTDLDDHGGDMVGPEDLVVEPRDPDTVHLLTQDRSYLTRDGGRSWQAEDE